MNPREQQWRARRRLIHENPFAIRLAAFAILMRFVYTTGVLVFTGLTLTVLQTELRTALTLLYALPLVWIWAALCSNGLRCLVCPTPLLKSRNSVKHRHAKKMFGSFTLAMAMHLLFARRFRCMHCGTLQRLSDSDDDE